MKTIWAKDQLETINSNIAFRKTFTSAGKYAFDIVVSGLYRIFINGKLSGYGTTRAAHGYARVDTYTFDLPQNAIVVIETVNYYINSYYLIKQAAFFGVEVKKDEKIIATASDFTCYNLDDRVQKVQRYSYQRTLVEVYNEKYERERFYAGEEVYPRVETSLANCPKLLQQFVVVDNYPKAEAIALESGRVSIDRNADIYYARFIDRIGPQLNGYTRDELSVALSDEISRMRFKKYENISSRIADGEYCVYKFSHVVTGLIDLEVDANEESEIYLTFDETDRFEQDNKPTDGIHVAFTATDSCAAVRYHARKGQSHFISIEPYTMGYVRVSSIGGNVQVKLSVYKYENLQASRLKFECADEKLCSIVEAARNTLAQNAVDVLTDCPSRERAGWLNDSFFSAKAEPLFTGYHNAHKALLENLILAGQLDTLPKGMMPECYPSDHFTGEFIPNCVFWAIQQILECDYFDKDVLDKAIVLIENALSAFKKYENEYGLLEDLQGWIFLDWSKANDKEFVCGVNFPSNMHYARILQLCGERFSRPNLVEKAKKIREKIRELSFDGTYFHDNAVRENNRLVRTNNISEACQYYAFFFGVAEAESGLYEKLFVNGYEQFVKERDDLGISPSGFIHGLLLRLCILSRDKFFDKLYDDIIQFYYAMSVRTGTLWEHPELRWSLNHGINSIAATHVIRLLTGFSGVIDGKACFSKEVKGIDCRVEIPYEDEIILVEVKDGIRTIQTTISIAIQE